MLEFEFKFQTGTNVRECTYATFIKEVEDEVFYIGEIDGIKITDVPKGILKFVVESYMETKIEIEDNLIMLKGLTERLSV